MFLITDTNLLLEAYYHCKYYTGYSHVFCNSQL